jgi:hypothetical protein
VPLRPGVLDPENRIINGAFDFWQRGTSSTANGYGSADRWANARDGGTVTQSRQAFALGDTFGNNNPTYFLRQTVSGQTLSGHRAHIVQNIEGVRSYAGQTITVLGWVRRSSGSGNMAVEAEQKFGTGGSPSSSVAGIGVTTVTLTASWAPFAVTMSVPSVSGKTLGTNNNDYLSLNFWTSAGSELNSRTNSLGIQTIGVDLWGVHIKVGTHTTAATDLYKQPERGPEFARCQRYCVVLGGITPYERIGIGQAHSSTDGFVTYFPANIFRTTPTVSTSGGFALTTANGGLAAASSLVVDAFTPQTLSMLVIVSGLVAGNATQLVTNNSTASRITFDAEL